MGTKMPKCPLCHSADEVSESGQAYGAFRCETCEYAWLSCPVCGETVAYMANGDAGDSPCEHVILRRSPEGNIWEGENLRNKFKKYLRKHGEFEDDDELEQAADSEDVDAFLDEVGKCKQLTMGDAGCHGSCFTTYYFCTPKKKQKK